MKRADDDDDEPDDKRRLAGTDEFAPCILKISKTIYYQRGEGKEKICTHTRRTVNGVRTCVFIELLRDDGAAYGRPFRSSE